MISLRFGWLILAVVSAGSAWPQSPVVLNWARTDTTPGSLNHRYTKVVAQPNGNFVVLGYSAINENPATQKAIIRSIRPNGTLVWERVISGPALTPGLRGDQAIALFDSSIFATLVGQTGLYVRLNGLTGATIVSKVVPSPTDGSTINPDLSAFFHHTKSDFSTSETAVYRFEQTAFTIDFHRVSNTLNLQSTEHYFASSTTQTEKATNARLLELLDTPTVRYTTSPDGVSLVVASRFHVTDERIPYVGEAIKAMVVKHLPTGAQQWISRGKSQLVETTANRVLVTPTTMEVAEFGRTLLGDTKFTFVIREGAGEPYSYISRALIFSAANGSVSQGSPESVYHALTPQNGFSYGYSSGYNPTTLRPQESFFKMGAGPAPLWIWSSDAVSRLPFQFTSYERPTTGNPRLILTRRTDSTFAVTDTTTFGSAPDAINDAVENATSGDGFIVGDRLIGANGTGGWVARYSQAPAAVGNSYTLPRNGLISSNVTANDRFAQGALAQVVTSARNGSLVFMNNGAFTYTPRAGYAGSDSFTYRIYRPGILVFSSATVFFSVTP